MPDATRSASPGVRRAPRPRLFGDPTEDPAAVVRGCLIAALESSFTVGELGRVLGQHSDHEAIREHGQRMYSAIMVALFPEEFGELGYPGVCPAAGPRRAGLDRLRQFAELLVAKK